ncbi:proton-conducting transporter transmembrane domain-containing protein [Roseicitreum antarcticum]|uniref:Probable inorganic carbon transporter subunit DabB n=1 Tax=Roseicitreum antarcticum TaxID=564137 RepID=A0A1H2SE44_9RHOB|nr:proton-conducting transporter membrane subunit [Roseicitreum antarcticum]SDW29901.1 NAD(P)H-quinone oxidoreductase subunit 5 [Roseicitreum antarcticum]
MSDLFPVTALGPVVLLGAAAVALARPGPRPGAFPKLAEGAALTAFALALAGLMQFLFAGPAQLTLAQGPLALILRADAVSATMALLVGFIGWIVMRYARSYLDGSAREGTFHGQMLATLAAVLVLVQAGSLLVLILAFVAVGTGVRHLLLFYPDRPAARRAATKFAWVWHAGDAALILAAALLLLAFGTGDLAQITAAAGAGLPIAAHIAVALVVLAAALKTATFPLHGWLTEVMEAPTPVSALLHAGIINAGGVLLITLSPLMQASPGAMAALVMVGGLTALFGAVVMLTQSAVKTALAWSTVSQMGFMLLQCGLGLWPLALLHIVAHSMYKAHAFLSSGGAITAVGDLRRPGPIAVPDVAAVARAFALALALYGVVALGFTLIAGSKTPQALALGGILIFGVAYLVAQGLADAAPVALMRRVGLASIGAALAYFGFQQIAGVLWADLPAAPTAGPLEWALIVLTVLSFGLVAVAQALFPLWAHHPAMTGLRVHLANGLYLNAALDRLIGGFRRTRTD